ncbi:hypothetical protein L1987_80197 [Smallanthus sonchifolius]|uniref:Uncharacterized protein n=1 Tax=Smallanthus sonchifolius TaxID=185202 RepID=A0ACB8YM69_9ASTR|nr:hypothetical protein L1987_80197 [Smallanthus sonchifolius]
MMKTTTMSNTSGNDYASFFNRYALAITGIEDRRYWNCIPTEESRTLEGFVLLGTISYGCLQLWSQIREMTQESCLVYDAYQVPSAKVIICCI